MGIADLLHHAASRRQGVVWLEDARSFGVSSSTLRDRVRRERWQTLHRGVWLAPGVRPSAMVALQAATLATGGAASRWSALWLHGLDLPPPRPPQIIVPYGTASSRTRGVEVLRSRTLRPDDRTRVANLPVVRPARAVIDLAPRLAHDPLRDLVLDAEHARVLRRHDLVARRRDLPRGVPGLRRLDAVLAELQGTRSDSGFEHEVRRGLKASGIPVHPEPFPYRCEDGVTVALDIAVPTHWVVVECDGFGPHTGRRVFRTDRVRWTQIARAWHVVWVTPDRWRRDRAAVIADVRRAMELAVLGRGAARPQQA